MATSRRHKGTSGVKISLFKEESSSNIISAASNETLHVAEISEGEKARRKEEKRLGREEVKIRRIKAH